MYALPSELTISQVDACRAELLEEINKNQTITLSDSDVVKVDTIGVQLLLTLIIYIASQNKTLIWQSNSSLIKDSITQLGINEAILNQYIQN